MGKRKSLFEKDIFYYYYYIIWRWCLLWLENEKCIWKRYLLSLLLLLLEEDEEEEEEEEEEDNVHCGMGEWKVYLKKSSSNTD